MKAAKFTLAGQDYYLAFNSEAMFAFEDEFGGANAYFDMTKNGGREAFSAVCKAAAILAEQGELARRALGYDSGPILTAEQAGAATTLAEALALRKTVADAIMAGYGREVEDEEDVDVGLVELERKKGKD